MVYLLSRQGRGSRRSTGIRPVEQSTTHRTPLHGTDFRATQLNQNKLLSLDYPDTQTLTLSVNAHCVAQKVAEDSPS
jgi:hypothetical protein